MNTDYTYLKQLEDDLLEANKLVNQLYARIERLQSANTDLIEDVLDARFERDVAQLKLNDIKKVLS